MTDDRRKDAAEEEADPSNGRISRGRTSRTRSGLSRRGSRYGGTANIRAAGGVKTFDREPAAIGKSPDLVRQETEASR